MPNALRFPSPAPPCGAKIWRFGCSLLLAGTASCLGNGLHESSVGNLPDTELLQPGASGPNEENVDGSSSSAPELAGLRRLSNVEYVSTVRELLGGTVDVAAVLLPDEKEGGFDNQVQGLGMSLTRLQGYQLAAEKLTDAFTSSPNDLTRLAPCGAQEASKSCLANFVASFGRRAWRRPLTATEKDRVVALAAADGRQNLAQQVNYAASYLLMSVHFLYKVEVTNAPRNTAALQLATRLASFLWSSTPDVALLEAAENASLMREEVYRAQVDRMLRDPRAVALVENFGRQWLKLRNFEEYSADPKTFPGWNDRIKRAALTQTESGLSDLFAGNTTLPILINGSKTYLNDDLAKHYGVQLPGSGNRVVSVDSAQRGPLLAQTAVLAATSSNNKASIVRRGKYVTDVLLCLTVPPPPDNTDTSPSENTAVTARELLEEHTRNPACAGCHSLMDPYGFVLENYDAVGGWRTTDNGKAVDTSAKLADGTQVSNIAEMSSALAKSDRLPTCFTEKLMTFAYGRPPVEADQLEQVSREFVQGGQNVRQLILAIVMSPRFRENR